MNAFNEPDLLNSWKTLATVWFNLVPLTGRELFWAAQITADATHLIECRFLPGVTAKMRMAFADPFLPGKDNIRYFGFDYVEDLEERHVELKIHCHEELGGPL